MTMNFRSGAFKPAGDIKLRQPYTPPVLEKLEPGTPRYEAAKAAFAQMAKEQPCRS